MTTAPNRRPVIIRQSGGRHNEGQSRAQVGNLDRFENADDDEYEYKGSQPDPPKSKQRSHTRVVSYYKV